MILKRLPTGLLSSNCYLIGDNGEGALIDPGAKAQDILELVKQSGLNIKYIILTHVHVDHIISVDEIRESLNAQVLAHEEDALFLTDAWHNGSKLFGLNKTFKPADNTLKDGDIINVGNLKAEIIHTPGHTPGGICIKVNDIIFTGDTLFRMSVGRTDLGNGDQEDLMNSLNRLMELDDEIIVYPGHGTATTIGYERKNNPFI
jgi:hydroxyacylglutathione hydrolase